MTDDLPPDCCGDSTTWRHKDERIDLPRLLQLIEENGGPNGLDLHGCHMAHIDARPEALHQHIDAYAQKHGPHAWPPWLSPDGDGAINLRGAHLSYASLEGAILDGAHMENAHLHRVFLQDAFLGRVHLRYAGLSSAHLESAAVWLAHLENAHLAHAHLEKADLRAAHLENAILDSAHLENANFVGSRLHGAFWREAYLDRTRIRRESLGQAIGDELAAKARAARSSLFHDAREAYLALKTNFDSIGRYDDAGWAYVKEQQMEKAMYFPTTAGHRWITDRMGGAVPPPSWGPRRLPHWLWWKLRSAFYHARVFFAFLGLCPPDVRQEMARRDEDGRERDEWLSRRRWARNWAYELLTGYGEWPHMPVIWAGVVVLLFAVIYAAAGNIATGDVGALQGQPTHSPWTAVVHSISAFATIGFNTLEPQGWGARLLTAIEAMLGIGLFALFVFTLGNRMRRS